MSEPDLPQLVRSRVRFASRGLASVRGVESVAVALAAGTGALAAAVCSGARLSDGGPWWAAGVAALLAGATWAIEAHLGGGALAARIDRELELNGALLTAWEVEGEARFAEGRAGRLGELLARTVAERVPAKRMLRAVLPVSAPLFALPFAGAILLFLALESARHRPIEQDLGLLSRSVGDQLAGLAGAASGDTPEGAEGLTPRELRELAGVAREAEGLAREDLESGDALEELRERLGLLEERLPAESELRERLEEAAETLDSALLALERSRPDGEDEEGPGSSDSGEPAGGRDDGSGGRPGSGLASAAPDDTMGDSGSRTSARVGTGERGVLSGPAWSEAYESIVNRWVASLREPR